MFLIDHMLTKWFEHNRLQVHPQRCIKARNRFSSCNKCMEICPVSAITFDKEIQVNHNACSDCMGCTIECPSGVFEDEKYPQFFSDMEKRRVISFSCDKNKQPGSHIRLSCLAQLDTALLLHAGNHSERITIQFSEESCKGCSNNMSGLRERIGQTINNAVSMVKEPMTITFNEDVNEQMEKAYTRRDLLGTFSKKMTVNMISPLLSEEEKLENNRIAIKMGDRTAIFQQILQRYEHKLLDQQHRTYLNTVNLQFTKQCNGCKICSVVCPTKAIDFVECGDKIEIHFNQSLCNACKSCIDICRNGGLQEVDLPISIAEFIKKEPKHIFSLSYKICSKCGEQYVGPEDVCEDCVQQQKRFH